PLMEVMVWRVTRPPAGPLSKSLSRPRRRAPPGMSAFPSTCGLIRSTFPLATSPVRAALTRFACAGRRRSSWRAMTPCTAWRNTENEIAMQPLAQEINDRVPDDAPGAREIGFSVPTRYNASAILFDNLAAGRGGRVAVTGPAGTRTYDELCADAARFGNTLLSLGLIRGDRILLFLHDTPAYP